MLNRVPRFLAQLVLVAVLIGFLLVSVMGLGQGILPFSSHVPGPGGSFDLASGAMYVDIPVRAKPGAIPFVFDLIGNVGPDGGRFSGSSFSLGGQLMPAVGLNNWFLTYSKTPFGSCTDESNFVLTDQTGAAHHFALYARSGPGTCPSGTSSVVIAPDDSGISLQVVGGTGGVGWKAWPKSGTDNCATGFGDPDGNCITTSYSYNSLGQVTTTWTDTLGATAIAYFNGVQSNQNHATPDTYTYSDSSGNSQTYTVTYVLYTYRTNFGSPCFDTQSDYATYYPSSVTTPTGATYTFSYVQTPGYGTGYTDGRLAKITLPTGGYVTYAYSGGNQGYQCTSGVVPTLTKTVYDGNGNTSVWTYVNSNTSGSPGNFTVTETDPANNQTVYNFSGEFQTQAAYYQGSATGTPLKIVMTCYNNNFSNCAAPSSAPVYPITKRDVYTNYNSTNASSGGVVENTYDSYGNVLTELVDLSQPTNYRTTTYAYGSGSGCTAIGNHINDKPCTIVVTDDTTNATKAQTQITYNSTGHPTAVAKWVSGSTWLTSTAGYNTNGTLAWSKDPAGHQTNYAYNGAGGCNNLLLTSTTYPVAAVGSDSNTWNCNGGVLTAHQDVNGNTTAYTYNDPLWRLTNTSNPDGGSFSTSYNTGSSLPWTITQSGAIALGSPSISTVSTLDGLGRTVSTKATDPNASGGYRYTSTVYNNLGQVAGVYNPYFTSSDQTYGETQYQYDALGRKTLITTPVNTYINLSYNGFAYQVQQYPNNENFIKIYQKDFLGRVIDVCEATTQTQADGSAPGNCGLGINPNTRGFLATASYDVLGNLTGMSYGSSAQNRTFAYDGLSRMTSESYPESGTTTYTYDASPYQGNLTSKTSPAPNQTGSNTVTATYTWDAMNRFSSLSYSDGTTPGISATYDQSSSPSGWPNNLGSPIALANGKGRLSWLSATNFTGVDTVYGYDTMGRVNKYAQCTPAGCNNGTSWVMNYTYNYIGEPAGGATIGGGNTWTNTYNSIGQLTTVFDTCLTNTNTSCTSSGDIVSGITYNALGQTTSDLLGNGFQEGWNYDKNGRVVSYNPGGTSPYGYWLTWNPGTIAATGDAVNGNYNYTYDSFGRLTCIYSGTACTAAAGGEALSWTYDRWGNRWKQNLVAGTGSNAWFSFNANNQYATGNGFSYDAAGNITQDPYGHTYTYDAASRMTAVDSGTTATYSYNSRGWRVQRYVGSNQNEKLFDLSGFPVANMKPGTTDMYFGEVYTGGRHWATNQWYGSAGTTMYLLTDWLGNIRMWKDQTGTTDLTCANMPYGDNKNCSGGFNTTWGVFGDENDSENNTYHAAFRQHSPNQGRWMHPDPARLAAMDIADPQSWNRYAYVTNSPVSASDPTGLIDPRHRQGHWWSAEADNESPYENFGRDGNCRVDGVDGSCGLLSSLLHGDALGSLSAFFQAEVDPEPEREITRDEEAAGELEPVESEKPFTCDGCFYPRQNGPLNEDSANTFRWYLPYKLTEPATYYRQWGSPAGLTGSRGGTYYSFFPPEGSEDFMRNQMSILPQWNSMQNTNAVTFPAGTTVYIGPAAAQPGYTGGGIQVFVPNQ